MTARRSAGFTLIEVVLATVLLVAGLTLALATLHSANAVSRRGEAIATRNERMRAVEGFLRQRVASALAVAMEIDPRAQRPVRFIGEPTRVRFVADVPDYLGRGGPYLHDIALAGSGDQQRLQATLTMVQAGVAIPESPPRPPESLLEGVRQLRFRYRGLDLQSRRLGDWQDEWPDHDRLPMLVEVSISDREGAWPSLLVALPQGGQARLR